MKTIDDRLNEVNDLLRQGDLSFELRQILIQDQLRLLHERDVLKK